MMSGMTGTIASTRTSTVPAPAEVRSVDLAGPAGRLEAVVNEGAADAPFAALICHPHPKGGGNMHNKVVYHAMKALNDAAWGLAVPVLRFNFRGTGLSQGAYHGRAESGDVAAAIEWLENAYKVPVIVAGFSFGAMMALASCCGRGQSVRALAALGLPTHAGERDYDYNFLKECTVVKLFLSGDRDQFAPTAQLAQVVASAAEPKRLAFIPGADHFFSGQLEEMQTALSCWLREQLQ